jgi:hypothetical protein
LGDSCKNWLRITLLTSEVRRLTNAASDDGIWSRLLEKPQPI